MKYALSMVILAALFIVCNSKKEKTTTTGNNTGPEKSSPADCYQYANNNDTISLKLTGNNGSISGTLVYALHEKDKNTGTIQGTMNDNILIADYTFMSEGVQSVRQVAFKKEGDIIMEGHGPMILKDNRMIFEDSGSMFFDKGFKLTVTDCLK